MFRDIITYIALAQLASDAGKHRADDEMFNILNKSSYRHDARKALHMGYAVKSLFIDKTLYLINKEKPNNVCSWFGRDDRGSVVVYFNIKYNGKRYQISFHYGKPAAAMKRELNLRTNRSTANGHTGHWEGCIGSSFSDIMELLKTTL